MALLKGAITFLQATAACALLLALPVAAEAEERVICSDTSGDTSIEVRFHYADNSSEGSVVAAVVLSPNVKIATDRKRSRGSASIEFQDITDSRIQLGLGYETEVQLAFALDIVRSYQSDPATGDELSHAVAGVAYLQGNAPFPVACSGWQFAP